MELAYFSSLTCHGEKTSALLPRKEGIKINTWVPSLHPLTHSLTLPNGKKSDSPDG